jgi:glycosyltransferase involved in cell wall biosynthesis
MTLIEPQGVPDVSVIIVTRDRAKELESCLRSIIPQLSPDSEVIIVAGSEASCPRELVTAFSSTCIFKVDLCPEPNICMARNIGLDVATNPLVLFIDDDAVAHSGWVKAYADAFSAHSGACIAGGLVLDARQETKAPEFAFGLIHPSGRQIEVRESSRSVIPNGYVLSVKGCNFAILLDRLQVPARFDEFYRFAFDETDLLMSMIAVGGKVVHVPDAVVDHLHAPGLYRSASPLDRDWQTEFASHTMFMLKHTRGMARFLGWCVVLGRLSKHAARALRASIGSSSTEKSGMQAIREAIAGISSAKRSHGSA